MGNVIQTTKSDAPMTSIDGSSMRPKINFKEVTSCLTCPFHSSTYNLQSVKIGEACSVLVGKLIDDGVDIEEGVDPGCPLGNSVYVIAGSKVLTKHDQSILTAYLSDRENNSLHIIRRPDIDEKVIESESDNSWITAVIVAAIGVCLLVVRLLVLHQLHA
jgi:hypothetical protein